MYIQWIKYLLSAILLLEETQNEKAHIPYALILLENTADNEG